MTTATASTKATTRKGEVHLMAREVGDGLVASACGVVMVKHSKPGEAKRNVWTRSKDAMTCRPCAAADTKERGR